MRSAIGLYGQGGKGGRNTHECTHGFVCACKETPPWRRGAIAGVACAISCATAPWTACGCGGGPAVALAAGGGGGQSASNEQRRGGLRRCAVVSRSPHPALISLRGS